MPKREFINSHFWKILACLLLLLDFSTKFYDVFLKPPVKLVVDWNTRMSNVENFAKESIKDRERLRCDINSLLAKNDDAHKCIQESLEEISKNYNKLAIDVAKTSTGIDFLTKQLLGRTSFVEPNNNKW